MILNYEDYYKLITINFKEDFHAAIKLIESNARKILFVLKDNQLIGSISDGDIRRHISIKGKLTDPVTLIMNSNPVHMLDFNLKEINELKHLNIIPIVTSEMKIINFYDNHIGGFVFQNFDCLIMAGGKGTRLGNLTKDTPKPLIEINGESILRKIIKQLKSQNIRKIHLSVNYLSHKIIDELGDGSKLDVNILYLQEKQKLGTAGSMQLISKPFVKDLIVINGDLLFDIDFLKLHSFHLSKGYDITIVTSTYEHSIRYGVINNENGVFKGIIEKPSYQYQVVAGIYFFNYDYLNKIHIKGKVDMNELIYKAIKNKANIGTHSLDSYWFDIGVKEDLLNATHYKAISND